MSDSPNYEATVPLGVGAIISQSFSVLFGSFAKFILLGFVGALIGFIINSLLLGADVAVGIAEVDALDPGALVFGSITSGLMTIVIYGLVSGLIIQLAYDCKLGRSNTLDAYMRTALPAVLPIAILSIVVAIAAMIGMFALIIGAFWVYAVFYVMAPVAVIERGGFGSLSRSAELTKEYRWPIVGLSLIIGILAAIVQGVAGFILGIVGASIGTAGGGVIIYGVLFALITAVGYVFGGIAVALTYARLREIKEGVNIDQIANVFD